MGYYPSVLSQRWNCRRRGRQIELKLVMLQDKLVVVVVLQELKLVVIIVLQELMPRLLRGRREEKEREEKNNKKYLQGATVDFHI